MGSKTSKEKREQVHHFLAIQARVTKAKQEQVLRGFKSLRLQEAKNEDQRKFRRYEKYQLTEEEYQSILASAEEEVKTSLDQIGKEENWFGQFNVPEVESEED